MWDRNEKGKQAMNDLERLIRYFYGVDKYLLREYVKLLSDPSCTTLCKYIDNC